MRLCVNNFFKTSPPKPLVFKSVLFQPDWTFNTGEQAFDLAVVSYPTAPPSILVLGETVKPADDAF